MILMEPFLLMTLHFSQIGLTEDLTFISILLSWANKSRRIIISPLFLKYKQIASMQSHEYFAFYGAVSGKTITRCSYLFLQVILPLLRSYGESSTVTRSPGRMRM